MIRIFKYKSHPC